jgi:SH3-like domain-containing protein
MRKLLLLTFFALALGATQVFAADFKSVSVENGPAVMYDAPSAKARPLFLYGAAVPLEIITSIEGWSRVRDAQGSLGWVPQSELSDTRMLQVRVPVAQVHAQPDAASPVVFEVEQDVLLQLDTSIAPGQQPTLAGWASVIYPQDGQRGYIQISQVFGL